MNDENIMMKVSGLNVGYSKKGTEKTVLENISFEIKAGQMVALVGPNGAGKSTLLNTLIGILKPLKGTVEVYNNANVAGDSKNKFSNVGFAAQTQIIDWYTNVMDNVILGPLLSGISDESAIKNSQEAMEIMEITKLSKQAVDHISGGQQQRVQVARELARRPKLYILDEPTTGLDVESAEKLFRFLKKEAHNGASVIVSSHDLTIVEEYMKYLLLIDEKQLIFNGLLKDFIKRSNGDQQIIVKFKTSIMDLNITKDGISSSLPNELSFTDKYNLSEVLNFINSIPNEVIDIRTHKNSLREQYLSLRNNGKEKL